MGNANGREESGGDSPFGVEEDGGAQVSVADGDGTQGDYHAHETESAYMAQSPSPLMFRPQMPAVPLQRPEVLHIPSPSWMVTSSQYEDPSREQSIPTMITWSYGGKEVAVEGSWDDYKTRKQLQRSGKDFTIMKVLPSGVYQYRFIVDGQWRYSPDQPWDQDEAENAYNILDVQGYVPEDVGNISGFEPPASPESSYNNFGLVPDDFAKEPPGVPAHLNLTLLNAPSVHWETPSPHLRPPHVVLDHLYMHRDRTGPFIVALGSTTRFHSKYVTVVLYKSIKR